MSGQSGMFFLPLTEPVAEGFEASAIETRVGLRLDHENHVAKCMIASADQKGNPFAVTVEFVSGVDLNAIKAIGSRLDDIVQFAVDDHQGKLS